MAKSGRQTEFDNLVAKRVRDDSKKLVAPTSINALATLCDIDPKELEDQLDPVLANERNEDIKLVKAFTGAKFLYSTKQMTETLAMDLVRSAEMKPVVAEKVRADSKAGAPTSIDVFPSLIPDLSKEELQKCYNELVENESYRDIKSFAAFNGAVYYFSNLYLDQALAVSLARSAQLQKKIVDKVRGDSKYLSKLTKMDALLSLAPGLEQAELQAAITELKENDHNLDIEVLTAKNGTQHLFSEKRMTMSYAQVLLRAEMDDPAYTIADTVREESRVYPRPTNIEIFKYGLFNMERERLDEYVDQAMEQYEDLMLLDIDGSVFLYSNLYMTEEQAILVAAKARREN